jgi:hypothetical protein
MNSTLATPHRTVEGRNFLKFRCRMASESGVDAHRDFTGAYYPRWRSLYLDEVRVIGKQTKLFSVYDLDVYYRDGDAYFYTADFVDGATIAIGASAHSRDKAARSFIITSVDISKLRETTMGYPAAAVLPKQISEATGAKLMQVRQAFIDRAGCVELGIKDAGKYFRSTDDAGRRMMDIDAFQRAVGETEVDLSPADVDAVFAAFDRNSDGAISFEEFISVLRGPMSELRRRVVLAAFRHIDNDKDGKVSIGDMSVHYNAASHPEVLAGALSEQQVMQGFLSAWDARGRTGLVDFTEFSDFYNGISATVEFDGEFEHIVMSSWKMY